jgi:hypothetical protein
MKLQFTQEKAKLCPSTLDAHHLLQSVHHVHQISLRGHDGINVFALREHLVDPAPVRVASAPLAGTPRRQDGGRLDEAHDRRELAQWLRCLPGEAV